MSTPPRCAYILGRWREGVRYRMEPGTVVWRETAQSLLRQKWLIMGCILLGLVGASVFALSQTERWTASSQLVIGPAVPPALVGKLSTQLGQDRSARHGPAGRDAGPGDGQPDAAARRGAVAGDAGRRPDSAEPGRGDPGEGGHRQRLPGHHRRPDRGEGGRAGQRDLDHLPQAAQRRGQGTADEPGRRRRRIGEDREQAVAQPGQPDRRGGPARRQPDRRGVLGTSGSGWPPRPARPPTTRPRCSRR